MPASMIEIGAVLISLLLVWAAWKDIRHRILPNSAAVAILIVALGSTALSEGFGALLPNIAHFAAALLAGIVLFAIRWIGAGDAKVYAALAAAVPVQNGLSLLAYVAAAMFVTVICWFGFSRIRRARQSSAAPSGDFAKVPLGLAIAIGGIAFLWRTGLHEIL
uniref:prepilin peptidase n=1 Tax=uncultured Erythrobacter sp. TaxID=263913 RepID=UPI002620F933|nr:prepilin peptidase [uncultured Erythrobacter sp.]